MTGSSITRLVVFGVALLLTLGFLVFRGQSNADEAALKSTFKKAKQWAIGMFALALVGITLYYS